MICGVDEAGRGALAGPVVAAAVVLGPSNPLESGGLIQDSKALTALQREKAAVEIRKHAEAFGIGLVESEEIDRINILQASLKAMRIAVWTLVKGSNTEISHIYVDGKFTIPNLQITQSAVPRGDQTILEVAAASILAKVYRDRLMVGFHTVYPQYHFKKHKGYGTILHRTILQSIGPCPIHRKTFRGVKDAS